MLNKRLTRVLTHNFCFLLHRGVDISIITALTKLYKCVGVKIKVYYSITNVSLLLFANIFRQMWSKSEN